MNLLNLSKKIGLSFVGDENLEITHACGLDSLMPGGISFLMGEVGNIPSLKLFKSKKLSEEQLSLLSNCVLVTTEKIKDELSGLNLILSDDPLDTHAKITNLLHPPATGNGEIASSAQIDDSVQLGDGVSIEQNVVIGKNTKIGNNTYIRANTVILDEVTIGSDCVIQPNVTVFENTQIGDRVLIHSNTSIGSEGYGFYQRKGENIKVPQIGKVILEDDVEIGANCAVDKARFHSTIIQKGTKLDNLIHVAHNANIGEQCLITAQVGIAGSTKIGHHTMIGGQSGIVDNLNIGDQVLIYPKTLVLENIDSQSQIAGIPAQPVKTWKKSTVLMKKLESMFHRINRIAKSFDKEES